MTATQTMNDLTIETMDLRLSVSKIQFRQAEGQVRLREKIAK